MEALGVRSGLVRNLAQALPEARRRVQVAAVRVEASLRIEGFEGCEGFKGFEYSLVKSRHVVRVL